MTIKLSNFSKSPAPDGVEITCDVEIGGTRNALNFNIVIAQSLAAKIHPNPAAFVIGMLIPAMERGEDIHVFGSIDAVLLHKLNTYAISLLNNKYSLYHLIEITCDQPVLTPKVEVPLGAMTGMSCGVDSLRTHLMYGGKDNDICDPYHLKLLAVFDAGAFFNPDIEFPYILEKAKRIADQSDCQTVGVRANFKDYYQGKHAQSCSVRHVACAYALIDLIDVYMVSSAYEWNVVSAKENPTIAMEGLDAILLSTLSSPRLELFSAVANETRHQKTIEILENSRIIDFIDTCTRPISKRDVSKNCGSCQKCGEILLVAESIGKRDVISPYFDMEAFHKRRFRIFQRMFTNITIDRVHCPEVVERHLGSLTREVDVPFGAVFAGLLVGKLTLLAYALGFRH